MFYEPGMRNHGLPHDPFRSCIVPRPIGWISTLSTEGVVNLAPYSFFNGVSIDPPIVFFAPNSGPDRPNGKDSQVNAEQSGEFVVNIVPYELKEQMQRTAAPVEPRVDEMALVELASLPSRLVKPPRVAGSPIHLECRYLKTVDLPNQAPNGPNAIVLGSVIGIHIDDRVLSDGLVDMGKFRPVARLGYRDYTVVDDVFTIESPGFEPWQPR